jgi:hypothetical protein
MSAFEIAFAIRKRADLTLPHTLLALQEFCQPTSLDLDVSSVIPFMALAFICIHYRHKSIVTRTVKTKHFTLNTAINGCFILR